MGSQSASLLVLLLIISDCGLHSALHLVPQLGLV